jgi:hypothetical protein
MEPATELKMLRGMVLRALYEFGCLACPESDLQPFIKGFYGVEAGPDSYDQLLHEEQEAFATGEERSVWLCLGIDDDLRGNPHRWGRSDWDLYRRVLSPQSERIRGLWVLRQLYQFVLLAKENDAINQRPLLEQVIERAELLPADAIEDVRRRVGNTHDSDARLHIWGIVAEEQYNSLAKMYDELSEELAERIRTLDPRSQLFGVAG